MTNGMTLADLRRQAGLTQREVGEKMGRSQPQVARYEALYPELPFTTVQKYIEALGGRVFFRPKRGSAVNVSSVVADPAKAESAVAYRNDPTRRQTFAEKLSRESAA